MRTVAVLIAMGAMAGLAVRSPPWPALTSLFSARAPLAMPGPVEQQSRHRVPRAPGLKPAKATRARTGFAAAALRSPRDQNWQLARDVSRAFESRNAEERERALTEWLPAWTASDPVGAIEWAASLEDRNDRKIVASGIVSQLAASDAAAAIEVAEQFDVGRDDGTLEHLTQIWAEEHPEDALSFVQGQPPGPARDRLLARIATVTRGRVPSADPRDTSRDVAGP